jgi:hypothetical protein
VYSTTVTRQRGGPLWHKHHQQSQMARAPSECRLTAVTASQTASLGPHRAAAGYSRPGGQPLRQAAATLIAARNETVAA